MDATAIIDRLTEARGIRAALTRPVAGSRGERRTGRSIMKRYVTGDVWTDANLLHAEERMAEARAFAARRALVRDSRPPRRSVRAWLGSLLLAVGYWLLGSVPSSAGPAWNSRRDAPGQRAARGQLGDPPG